jgi:head-tail adaptor
MFWTRATIERSTASQSATGAEVLAWADVLADAEARLLPLVTEESDQQWATPEESAYEVHLRGGGLGIQARDRVAYDGRSFDVRKVTEPPPFGEPITILGVVEIVP